MYPSSKIGAPKGPRDAISKRENLITAAESLFSSAGIHATKMDDISEKASVSKGTLYHYFPSKNSIIEEIRNKFTASLIESIDAAFNSIPEARHETRFRTWIHIAATTYISNKRLHDAIFYSDNPDEMFSMAKKKIIQHLQQVIDKGNDNHFWKVSNPKWASLLIFYGFRGACDEIIASQESIDDGIQKTSDMLILLLQIQSHPC